MNCSSVGQHRTSYASQHVAESSNLQPALTWHCTRRQRSRRSDVVGRAAAIEALPSGPATYQRQTSLPAKHSYGSGRSQGALPMYVALESDVLSPQNTLGYEEALRVGLKAVRLLGITGISVDVLWGVVEQGGPQNYNWTGYRKLFELITEMGFKLKVNLCFNSTEAAGLPDWVTTLGQQNPDIYFTDKLGEHCNECLTWGLDDVPGLRGRTAIQVYSDLMSAFRAEFEGMLQAGLITDLLIGLGPRAELRYPSHPIDATKRWEYPGVGEFQCYDKYLMSSLKACAEQVRQPPWGLGGPHDTGTYKQWPHQAPFFGQNGSWTSPYGKFFLQWYSEILTRHAEHVMTSAAKVFTGLPLVLNARIPCCHWWFNTASHAAELTAGYYNTSQREGYLAPFKALAKCGAGVHLCMAESKTLEKNPQHFSDPEKLLLTQRTAAAALHLPVTIENSEVRFDEAALARLHSTLFDASSNAGIELPQPQAVVLNRLSDTMFEAANWQNFKAFVRKVHAQ